MIYAACHCGAVSLEIADAPLEVTECNCSICRRYGVLWAYYSPRHVEVRGEATDVYSWDDRAIDFHRCRTCGCVSHWSAVNPLVDRMGVNARLMDPDVLEPVTVRHRDGAVSGRYVD
jgi:hypothetical protein